MVATQRNLRFGTFAAALASVVMIGYIATTLYDHANVSPDLVMAPVVATTPEAEFTPITNPSPAIVASRSSRIDHLAGGAFRRAGSGPFCAQQARARLTTRANARQHRQP